MEPDLQIAEATETSLPSAAEPWPIGLPPQVPEPLTWIQLRDLLLTGDCRSDDWEQSVAQLARISGALELALGEGLSAMRLSDRLISLGFSSLRDFAREVLGIQERKAQDLTHLCRELRSRPVLREAVRDGTVCIRAAELVLPVARGGVERLWVTFASRLRVRALAMLVRYVRVGTGQDEEEWTRFLVRLSPEERAIVDEALAIAGKLMPGSSRAQRLEAMAQEYLGEHPVEAGDDGGRRLGGVFRPEDDRREKLERRLEHEGDRWSDLRRVTPISVPEMSFDQVSMTAEAIDARLRELASIWHGWDALLGFGSYAVLRSGVWKLLGFADFPHYCEERLGLAPRTVEQRVALERKLWVMPNLRAARDAGLSYEKVRLLSRLPDSEVGKWLPKARSLTVIALRRELDDRDEAQMRAARVLRARVPGRVALDLAAAFRAVRAVEDQLLSDGKCLVAMARHFIETWKPLVKTRKTRSQKVRERDLGHCTVPGCSRESAHSHHVEFRGRGGGDEDENQTGICSPHHLRGVHGGYLRVWGRAPDALTWEFGGKIWTGSFREDGAPVRNVNALLEGGA